MAAPNYRTGPKIKRPVALPFVTMTRAEFGDTVGEPSQRTCLMPKLFAVLALLGLLTVPAAAQQPLRSECLAMANAPPRAMPVSFRKTAAKAEEVAITYTGHSTYYIDTPGGIRIATDFSGAYRTGRLPDIATMNRAHSTHFTLFPDPKIPHVLHGWGRERQAGLYQRAHRRTSMSAMSPPTSAATTATMRAAR